MFNFRYNKKRRRAEFSIEYAFLIAAFVFAATLIFTYMKGAVCGRWKDSIESVFGVSQYAPGKTVIH